MKLALIKELYNLTDFQILIFAPAVCYIHKNIVSQRVKKSCLMGGGNCDAIFIFLARKDALAFYEHGHLTVFRNKN